MSAEFVFYETISEKRPEGAKHFVGHIYAEGKKLPVAFDGDDREALLLKMEAFWKAEVEKHFASEEAREQRIAAMKAAREARKSADSARKE